MQRRRIPVILALCFGGCADGTSNLGTDRSGLKLPPSPYAIRACKLDVVLEPASHRLEATATLTVARKDKPPAQAARKPYLELHGDLVIDEVTSAGAPVSFQRLAPAKRGTDAKDAESPGGPPPAAYRLNWTPPAGRPGTLVIRYGGRLFQDVAAGEKPGEIHNFQMSAHVGEEGVYLGEDGAWYPQLAGSDDDDDGPRREAPLADFELTVADVPGMVLVASGNRDGATLNAPRGGRTTWRSPFPFQGMALAGGPHQVFERQVGDVLVSVLVSPNHASFAPGILDAVASYLELYQPLIGAYPYTEFSVVENFFSSGFAFPGFTLLASTVIGMGPMALQPGYLDHEMLHNWWGNGVFVSALDGNWCECLTSYCANYMRHVLEERDEKARAQRRDICYGLSRMTPDRDKPLGTFGRKEGAGRFIGYQKGSMVFAMLAREVGEGALWYALGRIRHERLGKPTGWDDIREAVERESGQSLEAFFDRWVRGSGVPDIAIDEARYAPLTRRLTLTLLQRGDVTFEGAVPIRLIYDDSTLDEHVVLDRPMQVVVIRSLVPPRFVELDPDFHVMRRVPVADVMPTVSGIGKSKDLLIVRSKEDGDAYAPVVERLKARYEDAEETGVREVTAADLKSEDLERGHALLLGKACLKPAARQVLKGKPLSFFGNKSFIVDGMPYEKPGQEVLCCVRNEGDPGGVICFYYGNSSADLKKAGVVTYYGGNSLVVFDEGRVAARRDFERPQRVAVKTVR